MKETQPAVKRRVLLLIERQVGHRLAVLEGIFRFTRNIEHWVCQGADLSRDSIDALRTLNPDGIIAGLWDRSLARSLVRQKRLVVDIFDWHPELKIPRVGLDNAAIGALAAEHFLDKGFRNLAFLGHHSLRFSVERKAGFEAFARENNIKVHVAPENCSEGDVWATQGLMTDNQSLHHWAAALPKPVAAFCASDGWGVRLTEACHALNLNVPSDVCVLGVDNDELLCQLSSPPLSSIRTAAERIGYAAASMLDRMMEGTHTGSTTVLFPPAGIVERQSTDVLQIDDPDLAMALRYIAEHAHQQISISAISSHVIVPRRTLQRRFKQALGRSIHQEVTRCRIERAKRLLSDSDLPIPQIARRCGFVSRERLSRMFHRELGHAPSAYRKHFIAATKAAGE